MEESAEKLESDAVTAATPEGETIKKLNQEVASLKKQAKEMEEKMAKENKLFKML